MWMWMATQCEDCGMRGERGTSGGGQVLRCRFPRGWSVHWVVHSNAALRPDLSHSCFTVSRGLTQHLCMVSTTRCAHSRTATPLSAPPATATQRHWAVLAR